MQLKLERALELKDGQLESFMAVATRQIKLLEERCAEIQAWEPLPMGAGSSSSPNSHGFGGAGGALTSSSSSNGRTSF
jgi:hypothetical protein